MRFIAPTAEYFCKGHGVDVGCSEWPLAGAIPIDLKSGGDAYALPGRNYDFVFSSHCLEHLPNYVKALRYWKECLKPGGVLFLYLPHPKMTYWHPANCDKHLHSFTPDEIHGLLQALGFKGVMSSGQDMYWSFCVIGFNGETFK